MPEPLNGLTMPATTGMTGSSNRSMLSEWLGAFPSLKSGVPSATAIWTAGRAHLDNGEVELARMHETLIYLLHNSVVPIETGLNATTHFGYGGIGVVLHRDAEFGDYVMIGQGVTIGGSPGKFRIGRSGRRLYVPRIGSHVYVGAGTRIAGGVEVGDFCVIGANSVVLRDVQPFSVVSGAPARLMRSIDESTCLRYKGMFTAARAMTNEEFVNLIATERTKSPATVSSEKPGA